MEERDARTVFCMQLSSRIRSRDLEDFFSVVGKVNDVRIITDTKTRRSKGIAYVEFCDVESVPLVGKSGFHQFYVHTCDIQKNYASTVLSSYPLLSSLI